MRPIRPSGACPSDGPYDVRTKHPAAAAETLIVVKRGENDARRKELHVTTAGLARLEAGFDGWAIAQAQFEGTLSKERATKLREPVARRRPDGFPRRTRRTSVTNTYRRSQTARTRVYRGAAERAPPRPPDRTERADRFGHRKSSSARERSSAGPGSCASADLRAAFRWQGGLRQGALHPLIIERDRRDEYPGRRVLHERSATDGEKREACAHA